jgi:hypothetical protein
VVAGVLDEEELMLAQAISASLGQAATTPTVAVVTGDAKKDAAAELRAKRLAALEKRGL